MNKDTPIACRPGALSHRENQDRRALIESLRDAVLSLSWSDRGLSAKVAKSKDTLMTAGLLVAFESQCCPFLAFHLRVGAGEEPFTLEISGPPGSGEMLRSELGL
ncbi:MAG TPA: hypothetical protein VLV83_16145 [Acidobacteriota bacterium]|nr:hypothetical protein [Acidobacteriota bacterium]